jgi:hypothetical protein
VGRLSRRLTTLRRMRLMKRFRERPGTLSYWRNELETTIMIVEERHRTASVARDRGVRLVERAVMAVPCS